MWRGWHSKLRARERACIHREHENHEYGEVIFPIVNEVSDPWDGDYGNTLYLKKEIRIDFLTEIRNILNGFSDRWDDYDFYYRESYNQIKGLEPPNGKKSRFFWLNLKETKQIIKSWAGNPLEVLMFLNHHGIIEKAVSLKLKLVTKK